jgi:hypothetical protein
MAVAAESKPPRRSWLKGCLILILGTFAVLVWAVWMIGEPGRRAQQTIQAIHPGMNALEVEPLLTSRHYCIYQVQRPDGWESVTRDAFKQLITAPPAGAPVKLRLTLTFMGLSPGRTTFHVEVGADGRVEKIDQPHNWD